MKITRKQLRYIINEVANNLTEQGRFDDFECEGEGGECTVETKPKSEEENKKYSAKSIKELIDKGTSEEEAKEMMGWKDSWGSWKDHVEGGK